MLRVTCGCHYVTGAKFNMIVPRQGGYLSKIETVYYLAKKILWRKCIDSKINECGCKTYQCADVQTVHRLG